MSGTLLLLDFDNEKTVNTVVNRVSNALANPNYKLRINAIILQGEKGNEEAINKAIKSLNAFNVPRYVDGPYSATAIDKILEHQNPDTIVTNSTYLRSSKNNEGKGMKVTLNNGNEKHIPIGENRFIGDIIELSKIQSVGDNEDPTSPSAS